MKRRSHNFPLHYQKALRAHLDQGRKADPEPARGLGRQASEAGLKITVQIPVTKTTGKVW